jgi:hypothetical protein
VMLPLISQLALSLVVLESLVWLVIFCFNLSVSVGLNCGFTYGALFSIKLTRTVLILSGIVPTSLKL